MQGENKEETSVIQKPKKDQSDSESDDEEEEGGANNKNNRLKIDIKKLGNLVLNEVVNLFKKDQTKILLERFKDHEGILYYTLASLLSTKEEVRIFYNISKNSFYYPRFNLLHYREFNRKLTGVRCGYKLMKTKIIK